MISDLWIERGDRSLCQGVSFSVDSGDILHIKGENGSGKSSLIKSLLGVIRPQEGRLFFNQEDITYYRDPFLKEVLYIGHLTGIRGVFTVKENLRWYAPKTPKKRLESALDEVGLLDLAEQPARKLSAGQIKRTALARLCLSDRPIWLLDEPFTHLDATAIGWLEGKIKQHSLEGGATILTSHQTLESLTPDIIELSL